MTSHTPDAPRDGYCHCGMANCSDAGRSSAEGRVLDEKTRISGMCTKCGAIETYLTAVTGTRDFSAIGEAADYPTGYGCELCA